MREHLTTLIFAAGIGQLGVLVASVLVPIRLKWRDEFQKLSRLHRQLYWVYGAYTVLTIFSFGIISLTNSEELAAGSRLARSICTFLAVFWGVRLGLQTVLDVREHL